MSHGVPDEACDEYDDVESVFEGFIDDLYEKRFYIRSTKLTLVSWGKKHDR